MVRRVRAVRRGLGKGKGKGYSNIAGRDPMVHSQSAKGIKQPQRVNVPISIKPKIPSVNLEPAEVEALEELGYEDFYSLRDLLLSSQGKIESFREDQSGVWFIEMEQGAEYLVFENEERAESYAKVLVRDQLEDEPDMFTSTWLEQFMSMTDTDRRIIAGEESDNIVDDLNDDEVIEEADKQDEFDEIQEEIDTITENSESDAQIKENLEELETKQEELVNEAREDLRSDKYDEMYESLADPINYFVDEQGIYTREELMKQSFIHIDIEEATEDAVRTDGWQHFVATYDGDSDEVPNTDMVVARTN